MNLSQLDWSIIISFLFLSLGIGIYVSKSAGKSATDFFLSGRTMPWWLLGVSMVATTFSADTPNLVTDIVRKNGVSGNWTWWAFLLTGMLTVFVYARLWRRSGVMTDLEFYELRYGGKKAAFLRGFRAIYLGVFFNIMIMASVMLAAIKIGGVMLGLTALQTVLIASIVTVIYSILGGLKGVILTDFFQFIIAMVGSVWAAYVIINLPEVGGLSNLIENDAVSDKISLLPDFNDTKLIWSLLIIPLAVQWWSVWYPGAEPGGGGYIAQRMLSAKDEKNAVGATLFFNIAHYALRPWPWILIALASIVVFPNLESIQEAFPHIDKSIINDDLAYPAMLTYLPAGLLGLVLASLIAAFMSTISTHLNWGASYVVNDFYKRFVTPNASEKELILVGRISIIIMMLLAGLLALELSNAYQAFNILLQIGAGTGLIFILRWFWWRINAFSEIAGMVISIIVAYTLEIAYPELIAPEYKLICGVGITTFVWMLVTFLTPPEDQNTLLSFYKLIKPHAKGWKPVIAQAKIDNQLTDDEIKSSKLSLELTSMFTGVFFVYGALFTTGYILYGQLQGVLLSLIVTIISGYILLRQWNKHNS